MKTGKALYLFELKLNKSAEAAMKQINLKDYSSKFALSALPIVKVGINFDPERRTIGDWKVVSQPDKWIMKESTFFKWTLSLNLASRWPFGGNQIGFPISEAPTQEWDGTISSSGLRGSNLSNHSNLLLLTENFPDFSSLPDDIDTIGGNRREANALEGIGMHLHLYYNVCWSLRQNMQQQPQHSPISVALYYPKHTQNWHGT